MSRRVALANKMSYLTIIDMATASSNKDGFKVKKFPVFLNNTFFFCKKKTTKTLEDRPQPIKQLLPAIFVSGCHKKTSFCLKEWRTLLRLFMLSFNYFYLDILSPKVFDKRTEALRPLYRTLLVCKLV